MATVIICPSCGTRYEIAAEILPEGRKVRCSKCSHIWQARPLPPLPEEPIAVPPQVTEPVAPPPPPPTPPEAPSYQYSPPPEPETSFSSTFEEVPSTPPSEDQGFYPPARNGQDTSGYESYAQADAEFDAGMAGSAGTYAGETAHSGEGTAASAETDAVFGEWDSAATVPIEEPPAPPEPSFAPQPEEKTGRGLRKAWLVFGLFLLGLTGFVLLAPSAVVSMLPGASRLYSALGMPINTKGLAFQNVT